MAESKSKYGALIRKAREPENHKSGLPDDQIAIEPDSQTARTLGKQEPGKPDNQNDAGTSEQIAIEPDNQIAIEPDNQITINPDNQITRQPENQITRQPEKEVNLCVKVPESLRRHWAAESKRHGVTMTEVMIQALSDRFGRPD